ncbi:MAG: hypothetical protein DIU74_007245 [Pseudomonadota bacterium]|nr:MAG: hypothetical protein DIU74_03700 [Pseudomonadota bacterium]
MSDKDRIEGEGSYSATKGYNERTRKFVESGKVEQAADQAAPHSQQEAQELREAERKGKQRAKGEDPALYDPSQIPEDPDYPRNE